MSAGVEAGRRLARLLFCVAGALGTLVAHAAARAIVQRVWYARAHGGHALRFASARWLLGDRAAGIRRLPARVGRQVVGRGKRSSAPRGAETSAALAFLVG